MLDLEGLGWPVEVTGLGKGHHLLHKLATCNYKYLKVETNGERLGSQARSKVPKGTFLITVTVRVTGGEGLFNLQCSSPAPGDSDVIGLARETNNLYFNKEHCGG